MTGGHEKKRLQLRKTRSKKEHLGNVETEGKILKIILKDLGIGCEPGSSGFMAASLPPVRPYTVPRIKR